MGSDIEILTPLYSGDLNTDDLNAEKKHLNTELFKVQNLNGLVFK